MQPEYPSDLLGLELPKDRFGLRCQSVLERLEIGTIGAFLMTDWDTVQCWQLGTKARDELKFHRVAMGQTPQELRQWLETVPAQNTPPRGERAALKAPHPTLTAWRPTFEVPEEWRDLPINQEGLGPRARRVVERLGLTTLGAFLSADIDALQCHELGSTARLELREGQSRQRQWLTEILGRPEASEELQQLRLRSTTATSTASSVLTVPAETEVVWLSNGRLNLPLAWTASVRLVLERDERAYDVVARRFNLDGSGEYTLEALSLAMQVSRERVRQVESAAIKKLSQLVRGEKVRRFDSCLHPALLSEIEDLKAALEQVGFPLPDGWLWEALVERYGDALTAETRPFFLLLCDVLGLSPLRLSPPEVLRTLGTVWVDAETDRRKITTAANAVMSALHDSALPQPMFDLLIIANRALKQKGLSGTDEASLRRILDLCPTLEAIAEDIYQCRFQDLLTNKLRVERLMREWYAQGKSTATINELCQEFNHRLAVAGNEGNTSYNTVAGACTATPALVPIGKSGDWILQENATETRPLHEVIEEAFLIFNRSMTAVEIESYVAERRLVGSTSIASLLAQHHKFQRTGRGFYALRTWRLPEAPPTKHGEEYQIEFDEALLVTFLEHDVQPIPLAQLTRLLIERLGWTQGAVRQRLERSQWLDFQSIDGTRRLAIWLDHGKDEPDPVIRHTKRGRIQNVARRILQAAPDNQMASATLSALIENETGYVRPLIYNALAAMPEMQREGRPPNMVYRLGIL